MNYMATGHIIAEARKARQLTQKQLAERIHVSDRTVSKWECGKGFPDPSLLETLSDALQIPIADIVCGKTTEAPHGEDMKLREVLAIILQESRKRTMIRTCKKVILGIVILLIAESIMFSLLTGGDGLRRWQWVNYFRESYETACDRYKERGVYRIEWITRDSRTVITEGTAINEVLSMLQDIELGKEYKDWNFNSTAGYLVITTDDGELRDSTFVLSFPAFTISAGIGGTEGRYFCYQAMIDHAEAFDVVDKTIAQLVCNERAAQYWLGME